MKNTNHVSFVVGNEYLLPQKTLRFRGTKRGQKGHIYKSSAIVTLSNNAVQGVKSFRLHSLVYY